jgi:hypothetical protein
VALMKRIIMLLTVVLLMVVTAAVAAAQRDGSISGMPSSVQAADAGIDPEKGTCPKAEPDKLPPDALAGASETALGYLERNFGQDAQGQYAAAAYRGSRAPLNEFYKDVCPNRLRYGKLLQQRSVQVDLIWPKFLPSASLSQKTVFVARFGGDYRVWAQYR